MRSSRFCLVFVAFLSLMTILLLVSPTLKFFRIFFEHPGIALTQNEVAIAHSGAVPDSRQQLIPKIIHQIFHDWHNQGIPTDWEDLRQTCLKSHQDWEYILWTEGPSRDFIETKYPWFLSTYDGYIFPVQKVDALRYFLMLHYGGIYIDLDNGCAQDLTPLLYYPTWTTDGGQGALSNNILGSVPSHPFWELLTKSLISYNYNYIFPYVTISLASGQWFETAVWEAYHARLPLHEHENPDEENRLYRIMMDSRPGTDPWVFFTAGRGETWVNWDNAVFRWIGDHVLLFVASLIGLAGFLWRASRLICPRSKRYKGSYVKTESQQQQV